MALPPQKFREIVFQILYSDELSQSTEDELVPFLMKQLTVTKLSVHKAYERAQQVVSKEKEIDGLIKKASKSYNFERIHPVEKNILRLGIYELFFDDSIPPKVAIAEGIRLGKKFATPESTSFINAVLDSLYQESLGLPVESERVDAAFQEQQASEEAMRQAVEKELESEERHPPNDLSQL